MMAASETERINWGHWDDRYGSVHPHEQLESYTPDGFHPVTLGDTFHDRCTVYYKLGFGGYSTVWLVNNLQVRYMTCRQTFPYFLHALIPGVDKLMSLPLFLVYGFP